MIDYYCALAKHEALQRLSTATGQPASGRYDVDLEILRQAQALQAITITRFFKAAWTKIRKAWRDRTESTDVARKNAIG